MPKEKRNRRARARREPPCPDITTCVRWFLREMVPLLRMPKRPRTRSIRHLRNAGIEVLEAMRALLDETIEWLRKQKTSPELRRIRVEQ